MSRPDPAPGRWAAGLAALAGDRPLRIIDDAGRPGGVAPDGVAVITASLDRVGVEQRPDVVDAVAQAAAVLLCPPPDPGGPGSVRAQPPETLPEWLALFAGRDLHRAPAADLGWVPSWAVLLERGAIDPTDLVRRYERLLLPVASHRRPAPLDAARLLSLTDRIIGLEATLAEANYRRDMALLDRQDAILSEQASAAALVEAERLIAAMRASASWRVGQRVVGPLRTATAAMRHPRLRHPRLRPRPRPPLRQR